jgi:hypothetical protein
MPDARLDSEAANRFAVCTLLLASDIGLGASWW